MSTSFSHGWIQGKPRDLTASSQHAPGHGATQRSHQCSHSFSISPSLSAACRLVSNLLHHILQHLHTPSTYARALFMDYSSVFSTILSDCLHTKLPQLQVLCCICVLSLSAPLTTNIGLPQGPLRSWASSRTMMSRPTGTLCHSW